MGEEELLQSVLYALHECGVPWVTPDQISVSMSEGGRLSVEAIVLHADEFEQAGGEAIRRTVPVVQNVLCRPCRGSCLVWAETRLYTTCHHHN